jgi:hypothetical protein
MVYPPFEIMDSSGRRRGRGRLRIWMLWARVGSRRKPTGTISVRPTCVIFRSQSFPSAQELTKLQVPPPVKHHHAPSIDHEVLRLFSKKMRAAKDLDDIFDIQSSDLAWRAFEILTKGSKD